MIIKLTVTFEEIANAVLEAIPHGAENAITSKQLEDLLCINHDLFKEVLRYLRENGAVICSTPRKPGYFRPRTQNEAVQYVRDEQHRITQLCKALRAAEVFVDGAPLYVLNRESESDRAVKS